RALRGGGRLGGGRQRAGRGPLGVRRRRADLRRVVGGGRPPAPDGGGGGARLPLVRRLAPTAAVVALGLGALFSIGILWVRDVLHASDPEFGLLVACFGVAAAGALGG